MTAPVALMATYYYVSLKLLKRAPKMPIGMVELTKEEQEESATAYEEMLVPAIFERWARHLLRAGGIDAGDRVLDVACGTGVVARAAADRVGPGGSVRALDVNPAMLAVAKRIAPEITWQEGSAESLPFDDSSFDLVTCQFGLMLFGDREGALREMARVLAAGGCVVVSVFDSIDNIPPYRKLIEIYDRVVGTQVGNALRAPFELGDEKRLSDLFRAAGIEAKISHTDETARFASVRTMVLADVKGWFPFAGIRLTDDQIETVVTEAKDALEAFTTSNDAVKFKLPGYVATSKR